MYPVQNSQALNANAGTTMTTTGQVIATSTSFLPQQILPSLYPTNDHQAVIIGQYGAAATQQSLTNFEDKAVASSCEPKPSVPVVQPNSFYTSVAPVHSSAQIFNGVHIGEISSQPRIITAGESGTMFNQTRLLGLQTANALPQGSSWTPGFHPFQNSFVLCNQPSAMTLHQIQPQMTMSLVAPRIVTKKKLVKLLPKEKTIEDVTSIGQQKQLPSSPVAKLKSVPGNQTGPNLVHTVNGHTKSTDIESKSASVKTKISPPERSKEAIVPSSDIPQASVAPTAVSSTPCTSTIGPCAGTSPFPSNTEMVTVNAEMRQVPSTSVACIALTSVTNSALPVLLSTDGNPLPSSVQRSTKNTEMKRVPCIPVSQQQSEKICSNPIQSIKNLIKSTGIKNKPVYTRTNIFSRHRSQTFVASSPKFLEACDTPARTVDASVTSLASSNVSSMTASSISSVVSTNRVPTVSSSPCLTNTVSSVFNRKPTLPKADNKAIVISHQTNRTNTTATVRPLKPQQLIQKLSLEPIKNKRHQVATVKPQVKTRIIDRFITKGSSEPLTVSQSPLLDSSCTVSPPVKLNSPEKKEKLLMENGVRAPRSRSCMQLGKCEFCKKIGSKFRFAHSKLFCSKICVKEFTKHTYKQAETLPPVIQGCVGSVPTPENKVRSLRPRSCVELVKCEFCKKIGTKFRVAHSKLFCSKICVKKFNKHADKRVKKSSPGCVGSEERGHKQKKLRRKQRLKKQLKPKKKTIKDVSCIGQQYQVPSPPVAQLKSVAGNQTGPNLVHTVNGETKSTDIESKSASVETEISSPERLKEASVPFSDILQVSVAPTVDVSPVSMTPSNLTIASSNNSSMTTSSISSDVFTNSVPTVSAVPPLSYLTNKALSDFDRKPSLSKALHKVVVASNRTNTAGTVATVGPLEPHQLIKNQQPQVATVKPQVITHIIDGFIVEESSEPLLVSWPPLLDSPCTVSPPVKLNSPEKKENSLMVPNPENEVGALGPQNCVELTKCEFCKKIGSEIGFTYSNRFCSKSCAKQCSKHTYKQIERPAPVIQGRVSSGGRVQKRKKSRRKKLLQKQLLAENENTNATPDKKILPVPEDESIVPCKTDEENSAPFDNSHRTPIEVNKPSDDVGLLKSNLSEKLPSKWTVQDVFEFLQNLPGYSEYADNFKSQEVDGQALLLLNEKHLKTNLCMKLGPALKLISQIKSIEEKLQL